ncbi:MAG: hypothetical protein B6229_09290, partial [Spirochaetaceae bacterium 4572_7]
YSFLLSIIFISLSFLFVLGASIKLQNVADKRFEDEKFLNNILSYLNEIQEPLEDSLEGYIPNSRPILSNKRELMKREIFFLIDSYLIKVDEIIKDKRGRKVYDYSRGFEELSVLYNYINKKIQDVSLQGFQSQLAEYNSFLELFRNVQLYSLILILTIVFISFITLIRNVSIISDPMYKLSSMASEISDGNFNIPIPDIHLDSVSEINRVAGAFNNMKNGINNYIEKLKEQKGIEQDILAERVRNLKMEQLLKRMELYTMQAQMNPHFLFNTINTGVQLAIVEEAERTADYMENLAELFRYNIRERRFFVPLRHEFQGLNSYINILRIRFPNSLKIIIDTEDEIIDKYECPAMILQPLVENSVIHAFKTKDSLGTISISIKYDSPYLRITVSDNGIGIEQSVIDGLLIPHTHNYKLSSKVMGLENVIQRCYFFYPEQENIINIDSQLGSGTKIEININTEVEPCIAL